MRPTPRQADLKTMAKLYAGLADPARLLLIAALRQGSRTAGELAVAAGLSPSGASNHLRCLLECGLVTVTLSGRNSIYALVDPVVERLLASGDEALELVRPLIEACRNYGPPARRHPSRRGGPSRAALNRSARPVPRQRGTPVTPATTRAPQAGGSGRIERRSRRPSLLA